MRRAKSQRFDGANINIHTEETATAYTDLIDSYGRSGMCCGEGEAMACADRSVYHTVVLEKAMTGIIIRLDVSIYA